MLPMDQQILSQLPVVALFMIFYLKINKSHQDYLKQRDAEMKEATMTIARSLDILSSRIYALGLGFVALASEKDPHKGAKAAQEAMERTVAATREAQVGHGGLGAYGD